MRAKAKAETLKAESGNTLAGLPLAALRAMERATWSALKKFNALEKAHPGPTLKAHTDQINSLWSAYRGEIERRDLNAALKEEVVFSIFEPNAMGLPATRELRRTKTFSLTGYWWRGMPPVSWSVDRHRPHWTPTKHFEVLNRRAA